MKMLESKSGAAWAWVYGLSFLFALGLLYTVFLYVFEGHLIPTINSTAYQQLSTASAATVESGILKYMAFFKIMPFVLFGVVVIYMIATTLYKQTGGQY